MEHLLTAGMIEGKQREKMLDALTKWLLVRQLTEALKMKMDQDL